MNLLVYSHKDWKTPSITMKGIIQAITKMHVNKYNKSNSLAYKFEEISVFMQNCYNSEIIEKGFGAFGINTILKFAPAWDDIEGRSSSELREHDGKLIWSAAGYAMYNKIVSSQNIDFILCYTEDKEDKYVEYLKSFAKKYNIEMMTFPNGYCYEKQLNLFREVELKRCSTSLITKRDDSSNIRD